MLFFDVWKSNRSSFILQFDWSKSTRESSLQLVTTSPFRNGFQNLLQLVDGREQKLNGASELHRFNRDVEDAISRIQEKYASIPEDLGRDLKAVQSYMKKHENFETELAALEGQVGT